VLILPLYAQQLNIFTKHLLRTEGDFQFKYAIFFTELLNFYHLSLAFCVVLAVSFICTRQQLIEDFRDISLWFGKWNSLTKIRLRITRTCREGSTDLHKMPYQHLCLICSDKCLFFPHLIRSESEYMYILKNITEWGTKNIFCILLFPNHVPETQKPILHVLVCFRMYIF
jgi:hypothetical protein